MAAARLLALAAVQEDSRPALVQEAPPPAAAPAAASMTACESQATECTEAVDAGQAGQTLMDVPCRQEVLAWLSQAQPAAQAGPDSAAPSADADSGGPPAAGRAEPEIPSAEMWGKAEKADSSVDRAEPAADVVGNAEKADSSAVDRAEPAADEAAQARPESKLASMKRPASAIAEASLHATAAVDPNMELYLCKAAGKSYVQAWHGGKRRLLVNVAQGKHAAVAEKLLHKARQLRGTRVTWNALRERLLAERDELLAS